MEQENQDKTPSKQASYRGLSLVVVQSSVCLCVLLAALCLRLVGGEVYVTCGDLFRSAMTENHVLKAPSAGGPSDVLSVGTMPSKEDTAVKPMSKTIAQASTAPAVIVPPLTGGVLTSPFGERIDPINATETRVHYGMDIAATEGAPLSAMMAGTVTQVGFEETGYGHYVVVKTDKSHDYLYAHCSTVACKVGDEVKAGDIIACVGNTGRSTGSHVHVEWRVDGKPDDPAKIIPQEAYA